jgi:hypothetical protein
MAAYIWNANPAKWHVVAPTKSGWEALGEYLNHTSKYVYWATPVLKEVISIGDVAVIWRTKYRSLPSGVVAIGVVQEEPKDLASGIGRFAFPAHVQAAGWSEAKASSSWKTGIRIEHTFWDAPLQLGLKPSQGTVRRLTHAEMDAIRRAE